MLTYKYENMAKKVKAAPRIYQVDIKGNKILDIKKFKEQNPTSLYFDSDFERKCYLLLKEANFNFKFHPNPIILAEGFDSWALSKGKGPTKLFKSKVRPITYTTDFAIYTNTGMTIYIEAKGFFRPEARLRFKMAQAKMGVNEMILLVFHSSNNFQDMKAVVDLVNDKFGGSTLFKLKSKPEDNLSVLSGVITSI